MKMASGDEIKLARELNSLKRDVHNLSHQNRLNTINARLFFGGFLGRNMLAYRRIWDVYQRFLELCTRGKAWIDLDVEETRIAIRSFGQALEEEPDDPAVRVKKKCYNECRKSLELDYMPHNRRIREIALNQGKRAPKKKGKFDISESEELLYRVLKDQETADVTKVDLGKVNWHRIEEEMGREKEPLCNHWMLRILPPIKAHICGAEALQENWKPEVLRYLLELENVKDR